MNVFLKRIGRIYPFSRGIQGDPKLTAHKVSHLPCSLFARPIHLSQVRCGLEEFFDEDQFDSQKADVGRPWRNDELRIKSNQDLHKLWYVLLKERNMVMTMKHMYDRAMEPLPNPERIDKVEESMENLLEVVRERNQAFQLLEYGKTDEPKPYITRNAIGIPYVRTPEEYYIPKHLNRQYQLMHSTYQSWMKKYLALYEEKLRRQRNSKKRKQRKDQKAMIEEFKMSEEEIAEELDTKGDALDKYLEETEKLNDVSRHGR